jgi:hypothetical protein
LEERKLGVSRNDLIDAGRLSLTWRKFEGTKMEDLSKWYPVPLEKVHRFYQMNDDPKGDKLLVFLDTNGAQVTLQLKDTAVGSLKESLAADPIPRQK